MNRMSCWRLVVLGLGVALGSVRTAGAASYQWQNWVGSPGGYGNADGVGSNARFCWPGSLTVDASGNVYVADTRNHNIRKISPSGSDWVVTTIAGAMDWKDESPRRDGTNLDARFLGPTGIARANDGTLYVSDDASSWAPSETSALMRIIPSGSNWVVTQIAREQEFLSPGDVAVDASGTLFVQSLTTQMVTPSGASWLVTDVPEDGGAVSDGSGNIYLQRDNELLAVVPSGPGRVVRFLDQYQSFGQPDRDATGVVYVPVDNSIVCYRPSTGWVQETLAGLTGTDYLSVDGPGEDARFAAPGCVAADGLGNLFVADTQNSTIRKMTPSGGSWTVTTIAGCSENSAGAEDGVGAAARLTAPYGIALDGAGNLFVAEPDNFAIRKVSPAGVVTTLINNMEYQPVGLAVDGAGNVYATGRNVNWAGVILKITPAGAMTVLAGDPQNGGSADGTGSAAQFDDPRGLAMDGAGNLYVADRGNHTIRKISPAGVVTTLAGSPDNDGCVDGAGTSAQFSEPTGIAVDASGTVYVADTDNNCIRKISPAGVVTKWVGGGHFDWGSADGSLLTARFEYPEGIAVDAAGNAYVTDFGNGTIRKISPAGVVTTIGGQAAIRGGSDGLGTAAFFLYPRGIAVDGSGHLYVSDNNRICKGTLVPGGWDAGYRDLGGGWRRLAWFGDYIPMGGEGWIWHSKHGFFFVPSNAEPQSLWLYAQNMGWLWTGNTTYPFLYRLNDGAWLWYNGSKNPRWFVNMNTGRWERWP